MRTDKAISDLAEIRQRLQLVDSRAAFRCFSLVATSGFYVAASFLQPAIGGTTQSSWGFVSFWIVIGLICCMFVALEVWWRSVSAHSRITFEWTRQLANAMLPVISVAALTTWAMMSEPHLVMMLPGFWAIFAGLAIASASRLLPSLCQIACFWWIIGGALAIRFSEFFSQQLTLTMSLLFGAGQLLLAICLFSGVKSNEA